MGVDTSPLHPTASVAGPSDTRAEGAGPHIRRSTGTVVADLAYGQAEVDNSRSRTQLHTRYEAVSDAAPNPRTVHTFGRVATEFFIRLHEQVRDDPQGDTRPSAYWPAAHVRHNIGLADARRVRNTVIIGLHVSSGCSHQPELLLQLLKRAAPREATKAAADIGTLAQQRWDVVSALSPMALSRLNLIACAMRSAEVPCRGCTPHMFFPAMSRGTFSGYFSAMNDADKDLMAQLLLPDGPDGLSPLMRAAGVRVGDRMFGSAYVVGVWATGEDGQPVRQMRQHDGPTVGDWFIAGPPARPQPSRSVPRPVRRPAAPPRNDAASTADGRAACSYGAPAP